MSEPWLIVETSGRGGRVGLAAGGAVVGATALDPARRHNRDLAPAVDDLLTRHGLKPRDLFGVLVSVGPGSFTGLRVGVMSAKVLAYALGCRLVAVPTFRAVAEQSPPEAAVVDVIGDALQGHVYVQRFRRAETRWEPVEELRIEPVREWAERLPADAWVSGPGLSGHEGAVPGRARRVPADLREPTVEAVFRVGVGLAPLGRDEVLRLEPLYLRPSSAEEKAARSAPRPG